MTIRLQVHVNGNYRATVVHTADGRPVDTVVVAGAAANGIGEAHLNFVHGKVNHFTISEEPVGVAVTSATSETITNGGDGSADATSSINGDETATGASTGTND